MAKLTWQDKAVAATRGSQFGAIVNRALGKDTPAPCFMGKASVTSDGYVMCSFIDRHETYYSGAFVGAVSDLDRNVEGLTKHLKLNAKDSAEFKAVIKSWIAVDYR